MRTAPKGNCYAASEAAYHLLGGKAAGWTPQVMQWEGGTHWFLRHASGLVLDLTAAQFESTPDYSLSRGCGFLTREPSARAADLMEILVWKDRPGTENNL